MSFADASRPWVFDCTHPDHPGKTHTLFEIAHGASDQRPARSSNWKGGFTGRPGLLEDLLPVVRAKYSGLDPMSFGNQIRHALRMLCRFLDAYEGALTRQAVSFEPVRRLHQITGPLLELMSQPGPDEAWSAMDIASARRVRGMILDAIHDSGLPGISLPVLTDSRNAQKDPLSQEECKSLLRFARAEVLQIMRRWQRADELAAQGRNLLDVRRDTCERLPRAFIPNEADAHTTYRELITRTGILMPSRIDLQVALGLNPSPSMPYWWPRHIDQTSRIGRFAEAGGPKRRHSIDEVRAPFGPIGIGDLIAGLYPTSGDIALCALLCLGRSAWNPSTLLSLDVEKWQNTYDDRAMWIFARKGRAGGAYQYTIARRSDPTSVFGVVSSLIQRSANLRTWLAQHPEVHQTSRLALRSPWMGVSDSSRHGLFVLNPKSTNVLNRALDLLVSRHNSSPGIAVEVRSMSSSEFRDVAANWVYRNSRFSMWITMLLLGHRKMSTTREYLASRTSRQESHVAVKSVLDNVFGQIVAGRSWDPVLSRAVAEGVPVDAVAQARLTVYRRERTYDGSVCRDPTRPPRSIDPTHPQDGKARCIQGHRCIAGRCPNGMVFKESLTYIARRVAELEWNEQHLGEVRFGTASDAEDLWELRQTLEQWPAGEVDAELARWRQALEEGRHRPIQHAGQHV